MTSYNNSLHNNVLASYCYSFHSSSSRSFLSKLLKTKNNFPSNLIRINFRQRYILHPPKQQKAKLNLSSMLDEQLRYQSSGQPIPSPVPARLPIFACQWHDFQQDLREPCARVLLFRFWVLSLFILLQVLFLDSLLEYKKSLDNHWISHLPDFYQIRVLLVYLVCFQHDFNPFVQLLRCPVPKTAA